MQQGSAKPEYQLGHARVFSTTADIGLHICARDYSGLLEHAVKGINRLVFGRDFSGCQITAQRTYTYHGDSFENVVVNLLNDILFYIYQRSQVVCRITATLDASWKLQARLQTASPLIDPTREIKSVTYHNLKLVERNHRWHMKIVCDI